MKIVSCDGGSFIEPPNYKFHNSYFSVVDGNGELIHFEKDIGDFYSGVSEYKAIEWVIKNIPERPLTILNDCTTAIAWAKKGSSRKSKFDIPPLPLQGVTLKYKKGTDADMWNAKNHSPKKTKRFYIKRYYQSHKEPIDKKSF